MKYNRIYNFNPGPAALPLSVLEEIQHGFLNFGGTGMSIAEISHRSPAFEQVIDDAAERTKRLLKLGDAFHVLFLQGGASSQFFMVPMNFLADTDTADYVNTGTWSTKAIKEAQLLNKPIRVAASSEDKDFSYIPEAIAFQPNAVYVHITSNNTIKGTQWHRLPDTGGIPLVADMSSDIMSRPLASDRFGLIYAGAQKNIGPAGVCMVIVREDLLARVPDTLPSMLKYTTFVAKKSLYNTPPCLAIYTLQLVLKWLEEHIGGLEKMAQINAKKAKLVYDAIDAGAFYRGTARPDSRSEMNVTFRLPTPQLEEKFIADALANALGGLKGHRSVGGCRASIYNAMPMEGVEALVSFMKEFERTHG
jgi:phosphoserine aminotransferase